MNESILHPFVKLIVSEKDIELGKSFCDSYDLELPLLPPERSNLSELLKRNERKCRFCQKSIPEVTFNDKAHLVPELLGNNVLFSDFECDKCNYFFGKNYEDELAKFLGVQRTLSSFGGLKKVPGFESGDGVLKAKQEQMPHGKSLVIARKKFDNDVIKIDCSKKEILISVKKPAYRPLSVYKAILKMALSILPENEVNKNYSSALRFLLDTDLSKKSLGCFISIHQLPFTVNFPFHAFIYKKRYKEAQLHTHVIAFYFHSYIIAIPVPLNVEDIRHYAKIEIKPYPPFLCNLMDVESYNIKSLFENFSSNEKINEGIETLKLKMNPKEFENSCSFNYKTGEKTKGKFNPSSIKEIYFIDRSTIINPDELANWMRQNRND